MGQFDVGVPFQIAHKQSDFGLHIAFPKREKRKMQQQDTKPGQVKWT